MWVFELLSTMSVVNMNLKLVLVLLGLCCDILPSGWVCKLVVFREGSASLRDCKSGMSGLHEASIGGGTFYLNDALVALVPVFLFEYTKTSIHILSFLKLLCPFVSKRQQSASRSIQLTMTDDLKERNCVIYKEYWIKCLIERLVFSHKAFWWLMAYLVK